MSIAWVGFIAEVEIDSLAASNTNRCGDSGPGAVACAKPVHPDTSQHFLNGIVVSGAFVEKMVGVPGGGANVKHPITDREDTPAPDEPVGS